MSIRHVFLWSPFLPFTFCALTGSRWSFSTLLEWATEQQASALPWCPIHVSSPRSHETDLPGSNLLVLQQLRTTRPLHHPIPSSAGIWDSLIQDTITNSFTFKAFPSSICPYPESHLDCNFFIPRGKVMKSMAALILHGTKLLEGSASRCLGSSSVNLCAFGKIQEWLVWFCDDVTFHHETPKRLDLDDLRPGYCSHFLSAPLPLIGHLSWSFLQGLGVSAVVDTAMADALDSMSAEATSDVGNSHRKSKTEEKSPVTWYEQVNLVREFVQNAQFPFSFPRIYHEMSWCSMMFQSHKDIHRSFKPRFPTIFVSQAFQTEFESLTSFGTLFGDALKTADTFGCVAVGHPKKNITKMCQTFLTNKWRWWVYHLTCLTGCFKKKIYRGDLPHHRFHLLDSLALSRWNLSFGKWWEALGVRNWKIWKIEGNFQPESAVPAYTTQIGVAE